jgi:hypothetical protein
LPKTSQHRAVALLVADHTYNGEIRIIFDRDRFASHG